MTVSIDNALSFLSQALALFLIAFLLLYPENLIPKEAGVLSLSHVSIAGLHHYLSMLIIILALSLIMISKRDMLKVVFSVNPILWQVVFLIIWCASSLLWAKYPNLVVQQFYYLLIMGIGTYLLFSILGLSLSYKRITFLFILLTMIIVSALGIAEAVMGRNILYKNLFEVFNPYFSLNLPILKGSLPGMLTGKITSTIGHPAFLSLLIVMTLPIAMYFTLEEKGYSRVIGIIGLIALASALLLTMSRIGWLISIVVIILYLYRRGRKTILIALFCLMLITLTSLAFSPVRRALYNRAVLMIKSGEPSFSIRKYRYVAVFRAFSKSPLTGLGFGQFYFRFTEFAPQGTILDNTLKSSDNQWGEILADTGILGLGLFLWIFISLLYHLYRSWNKGNLYAQAVFVSSIAAFIHSIFTPFLFWPSAFAFLIILISLSLSGYKPDIQPFSFSELLKSEYSSLSGIYRYREMLYNMILKALKIRYKGSLLGVFWIILHPLSYAFIFILVFSIIVRLKVEHYPFFLLSGLLPWIFFQTSISAGAESLVDNPNLIKKVYFPKEILPLSLCLANISNLLTGIIILLCIIIPLGINSGFVVLLLPFLIFFHLLFISGLVFIVSSLNVFYRDIGHITEIALTLLFYLTPVFYPESMVPESLRSIYMLSPLSAFTSLYRYLLLGNVPENPITMIAIVIGSSCILFLMGSSIFRRFQSQFAKEV